MIAHVMRPEPLHHAGGEEVAFGILGIGAVLEVGVGDRVDQQLVGELRPAGIACPDRHGSGEVAARAVTGHGQAVLVDPKVCRVVHRPQQGVMAIVERAGEGRFRGKAVVHRQHRRAAGHGKGSGRGIVRLDRADHPASAMVEQHQRRVLSRALGLVEPRGDGAAGQVQCQVAHFGHGRGRAHLHRPVRLAQGLGRDRLVIDRRHLREEAEQRLDLRIERHRYLSLTRTGRRFRPRPQPRRRDDSRAARFRQRRVHPTFPKWPAA